MATPQSSHALDGRAANEPVWLDDSDLIDELPAPAWPFDGSPGAPANLDDFQGMPHAAFSATVPPPPRRSAAVPAMAIAAAIIMTFGVGWWVGRVHPPPDQEASVARTVRGSAHSVRAEAEVIPAILTTATARQAPAIPITRPVLSAPAPVAPVSPVASEQPTEAVAQGFVPTEL